MAQKFPVKVVVAGVSLGEFEAADYVGIDDGGTGAVDAPTARTNLGAAAAADLTSHENDTNNPHAVDLADVGGEPANANIQAHIVDTNNPHGVDLNDVGGEPANANIQAHIASTANPHSVTAAQAGAIPTGEKGAANGVATLDGSTLIPIAQIPPAAISKVHLVADATARLAISPLNEGDEAIQADDDSQWIWDGSAWHERASKQPMVLQVSGNSKETAYKIMAQSIWPGSDNSGVPTAVKANAFCDDAADLGALKIYDATNALTIAEVTGITAVDLDSIIDLGVLSNISAGEAVWEWQGLQVDDAKNSRIDIQSVVILL